MLKRLLPKPTSSPAISLDGTLLIDFRAEITALPDIEVYAVLAETAFRRYPGIPLGNNVLHLNLGASGTERRN
ncbi:MAG TPA: hypothetical protein G4O11_08515 [Anaerolineae bacterium]|nr:hypothetical protein [Anaerolineae bacterium]